MIQKVRRASLAALVLIGCLLALACGADVPDDPRDLLLAPADFEDPTVSVASSTMEQSLDGPSAQVELQASGFRVLQSLVLFESREAALAALDGIRADLVSRGETGPGQPQASGVFEHMLGQEEAASVFFIEGRGLVRLTVTGADRQERLSTLSNQVREKLAGL